MSVRELAWFAYLTQVRPVLRLYTRLVFAPALIVRAASHQFAYRWITGHQPESRPVFVLDRDVRVRLVKIEAWATWTIRWMPLFVGMFALTYATWYVGTAATTTTWTGEIVKTLETTRHIPTPATPVGWGLLGWVAANWLVVVLLDPILYLVDGPDQPEDLEGES